MLRCVSETRIVEKKRAGTWYKEVTEDYLGGDILSKMTDQYRKRAIEFSSNHLMCPARPIIRADKPVRECIDDLIAQGKK